MHFTTHLSYFEDCFQVKFKLLVLVVFMLFASFCDPNKDRKGTEEDVWFGYVVDAPDRRYELPSYLEEISGLSYFGEDKIACVQDEKGNIYVLDLVEGKISNKYEFGDDGDYEDITVVGKNAYVLENNGDIYRIKDFKKKDRKVKKFNTPLKEKNDTEGMTFDPRANGLLVACKGSPSIDKEKPFEGSKAIYLFDLQEEILDEYPVYLVDLKELDRFIDRKGFSKFSVRVAKRLGLVESETSFHPSGIAIHPQSGEIFIISSVGKLMIILDRGGKVLDAKALNPVLFRQPEGICFSPEGDMYISNEGNGGMGYVLKFNFHERQE